MGEPVPAGGEPADARAARAEQERGEALDDLAAARAEIERRRATITARHRPTECDCGTDWHTHRCRGCSQPWPCPEITDQADRLGIDTEEVRADG